jgi:hypothetical protein
MRAALLLYLCLVASLQAIEMKPLIEGFGVCNKMTLAGNVIWSLEPVRREEIAFQTEDPLQIKSVMNWIGALRTKELPTRLYGHPLPVSADESLVFKFIDTAKVEHRVVIYSRSTILVESDREFASADDIDIRPLLAILKAGKGERK